MAGGMGGLMNTVSCVRNAARATTAKLAQPIHPLAYRALKMKLYLIDLFYPPSISLSHRRLIMETDTKKNVYIYMHVLKTKTKSGVIDVRLV